MIRRSAVTVWPRCSTPAAAAGAMPSPIAPTADRATRSAAACPTTGCAPASSPLRCARCQCEYRRPEDRRFHAEANCCPKCGPQLFLLDGEGHRLPTTRSPMTLALLRAGEDRRHQGPGRLPSRLRRPQCGRRRAAARAQATRREALRGDAGQRRFGGSFVQMGIGEPGLLTLPTRPAILIRKRSSCDAALPGVAPDWPGWASCCRTRRCSFCSSTKRRTASGGCRLARRAQDLALVMTSANPGGEPLVVGNSEALLRLYGIADAFLMHDRDIVTRCDDSVARITTGGLQFIRRARGYTPRAIKLPISGPSVLASAPGSRTRSVSRAATRPSFRSISATSTTPPSAISSRKASRRW
jgi:hydrogenase maturation protein HypF